MCNLEQRVKTLSDSINIINDILHKMIQHENDEIHSMKEVLKESKEAMIQGMMEFKEALKQEIIEELTEPAPENTELLDPPCNTDKCPIGKNGVIGCEGTCDLLIRDLLYRSKYKTKRHDA